MSGYRLMAVILAGLLLVGGLLYAGLVVASRPAAPAATSRTLKIGETFTVLLDENPSTGYTWTVDYDRSKLQLVKDESLPPAKPMPGAANKHTWEFKAIAAGQTSVRFSYARPWESRQPEKVETYVLQITE